MDTSSSYFKVLIAAKRVWQNIVGIWAFILVQRLLKKANTAEGRCDTGTEGTPKQARHWRYFPSKTLISTRGVGRVWSSFPVNKFVFLPPGKLRTPNGKFTSFYFIFFFLFFFGFGVLFGCLFVFTYWASG